MSVVYTPSQVVNKSYLRNEISKEDAERFKAALMKFYANYNEDEGEEHNKNIVHDFLKEAFYSETNAINTYGNADSAIYANAVSKGSVPVVLCETKSSRNSEMIDHKHLNRKALHELILYYLREEIGKKNRTIQHLIITDGYNWFLFEKKTFLELFANSKKFANKVMTLDNSSDYKTKDIYAVIKAEVAKQEDKIAYTYFNIEQQRNAFMKDDFMNNPRCNAIYKVLSPTHLLKQPFLSDANTLNRSFYNELLYLMGLTEVKDSSTNMQKIERLKKSQRQRFSMLEQTISLLEDRNDLADEEDIFETALGLVMEWMNRILFLKLLESQLKVISPIKPFMTIGKIPNYCTFHELCMKILAKNYDERIDCFVKQFPEIPYLNSSLFELSEAEHKYFSINALNIGEMKLYDKTVLKHDTPSMSSLEYLFHFLGAYNFGADTSEMNEANTIINASVLGLIFEKINGYKDGSFFTPGYVTSYICKDMIRKTIVDRFNAAKGWGCKSFEDVAERTHNSFSPDERCEYNDIVNSITICDPAVGSGHYLVSALNEMIMAKYDLGILQDHTNKPRLINAYKFSIKNEELVLTDYEERQFVYNVKDCESQRIQEALFEEKKTIIEKCLFGVDLNPKSVQICCLRLWIELLKNAYYYKNSKGELRLQTLPNIDINIKQGNSLLSRYQVHNGEAFESISTTVSKLEEYKSNVKKYKNCSDKQTKHELKRRINQFKTDCLNSEIQLNMYGTKSNKDTIYSDALEWAIEIPEILSDKGEFVGFDIIVGNPPYVSLEKLDGKLSKFYGKMTLAKHGAEKIPLYQTYDSKGDLYMLFVERAMTLLKPNGRMSFIMPNKWMKVGAGKGLRKYLATHSLTRLVDFCDNQVFPEATTYTCIVSLDNNDSRSSFLGSTVKCLDKKTMVEDIANCEETFSLSEFGEDIWVTSSIEKHKLLCKLKTDNQTLCDTIGDNAFRGILTGLTEAFLIDEQQMKIMTKEHSSSADVIRPFIQGRDLRAFRDTEIKSYLIFLPKGFTLKGMHIDLENAPKPTEEEAWSWLQKQYPSIANHLKQYEIAGKRRTDKGDYWWELRACNYYDKFGSSKIIYQVMQTKPCFTYDNTNIFCNNSVWFLSGQDKRLLALLNSDVAWWLMREFCPRIQNGCQLIWDNFRQIPIPHELPNELAVFADRLIEARQDRDEEAYDVAFKELNAYVRTLYGIDLNIDLS